jgi:4'-phosphopantetheinyl transferase
MTGDSDRSASDPNDSTLTDAARWARATATDVPQDDDWLTDHERAVLSGLAIAKRRADWRLGRWTAKALLSAELGAPVDALEIRAAGDGAPEALCDDSPTGLSLSLSHRSGMAVAAIATGPTRVGIDLELIEARSDAFVREWLADEERDALPRDRGRTRDVRVLCSWVGKEASAKARREGLRLDVRRAVVISGRREHSAHWAPLAVHWVTEELEHRGWWHVDRRSIVAVVTDPPTGPPVPPGSTRDSKRSACP